MLTLLVFLACCLEHALIPLVAGQDQRGPFPPLDGVNNNVQQPAWGAVNATLLRQQVRATSYGRSGQLLETQRPSARNVSVRLAPIPYMKDKSKYRTSYLVTAVSQLVVHDIVQAWTNSTSHADIPIPQSDPLFADNCSTDLPFSRSLFAPSANARAASAVPEQFNKWTAFVDVGPIYGITEDGAGKLRRGFGGRLRVDDNGILLPLNQDSKDSSEPLFEIPPEAGMRLAPTQFRAAGDPTVNQNPGLLAVITILWREHNRRAEAIAKAHPEYTDDRLFNEARKWVIALWQRVHFDEYLPAIGISLAPYQGYNPNLNPGIDNFFSTVAYRYGHSGVGDTILRLNKNWTEHEQGHLPLADVWWSPDAALSAGVEPVLRGLIVASQANIDTKFSRALSGRLFGPAGGIGHDLFAINIQRGRDHGIPDYNTCRQQLGLPRKAAFREITPDRELQAALKELYRTVDNIDAYVGGLAEEHDGMAHMGELFKTSIRDQMTRTRDGDYWYYKNKKNGLFTDEEIREIDNTGFRTLLQLNTDITDLPDDIWHACDSCAANAGQDSRPMEVPLWGNTGVLSITKANTTGRIRVKLESNTVGWLGFGVPRQGANQGSYMPGADMAIFRMVDGVPIVADYWAPEHTPPMKDQEQNIQVIEAQQSAGRTYMVVERALKATEPQDNTIPETDAVFIVARGTSNDLTLEGHGPEGREFRRFPKLFDGAAGACDAGVEMLGILQGHRVPAATGSAQNKRKAHGVMMAITFILLVPLGALTARQVETHWITSLKIRASLFYAHIITQVTGVVIATTAAATAVGSFGVHYAKVPLGHGQLGVAMLVLLYFQVVMAFIRPRADRARRARFAWSILHHVVGRSSIFLGIINCFTGAIIYAALWGGNLELWLSLFTAAICVTALFSMYLDKAEKHAVHKIERGGGLGQRTTAGGGLQLTEETLEKHLKGGSNGLELAPDGDTDTAALFARDQRLDHNGLEHEHEAPANWPQV